MSWDAQQRRMHWGGKVELKVACRQLNTVHIKLILQRGHLGMRSKVLLH